MDAAAKVPLSERINFRLVGFIAVIVVLVGYPVYVMLDQQLSGGIKHAAGGYKEVNLKAMSTFTFDQVNGRIEDVPQKWRDLNGQKVILRGEMYEPLGANQDDVQKFDLVFSIAKCCVTSTPQVQHFVKSQVLPGKSIRFYDVPVEVRGILRVDVKREEGRVSQVYALDVESVRPYSG
jgi:hypothetical protein